MSILQKVCGGIYVHRYKNEQGVFVRGRYCLYPIRKPTAEYFGRYKTVFFLNFTSLNYMLIKEVDLYLKL